VEFRVYSLNEVFQNTWLLDQMKSITDKYEYVTREEVVSVITDFRHDDRISCICSVREEEILAFAIVNTLDDIDAAWIGWFIANNEKTKGFENKVLLDKIIEFCQSKGAKKLRWYCLSESWKNINKKAVLERFGYNVSSVDCSGEVEIDISDEKSL